jgi:MFS family permease
MPALVLQHPVDQLAGPQGAGIDVEVIEGHARVLVDGNLLRFAAMGAYIGCLFYGELWFAVLAFCLVAFFCDFGIPAMWAFNLDVGGRYVGSVLGWGNMWGNFGAAVGPLLLNEVVGNGQWDGAFVVGSIAFFVSGLCALGIERAAQHIMFHTEFIRINRKDIPIERTRGMAWIAFQQADTFDLTQGLVHVRCHLFALFGLFWKAFNANERERCRDLTQPEVASHLIFLGVILGSAAQRMRTSAINDRSRLRSQLRRLA